MANAGDSADTISAQEYFDLTASYDVNATMRLTIGAKNLLDSEPPTPLAGGNFFGTLSEYDPIGRSLGASLRARF